MSRHILPLCVPACASGRSSAPLRECRVFRVNHRPTVTLVQLLERLAGVVESVELLCPPKEPSIKVGRRKETAE